jgi:predicted negative regulator of RcsB-dependent stress response
MAKRQPGSRRRTPEHDDDAFVAKVFELSTWARKNSQVLILFGVVLVLVVAGIVYYANYRERMGVMAVEELETIQQLVGTGDTDAARVRLAQYIERFEGTPTAVEARMLLARMYLQTGDAGQAIDVLDDAGVGLREPMGPELAVMLARAYEERGEPQEAEQIYLRVADGAPLDFQAEEALADAARVRQLQGDAAGAIELYERLLERLELGDPERGRIQMRLAEARAQAARS